MTTIYAPIDTLAPARRRTTFFAPKVFIHNEETGVHDGTTAFASMTGPLDELYERVGTSHLIRRPWLDAWMDTYQADGWRPWVLTASSGRSLHAVAPLVRRRVAGRWQVACMGGPEVDRAPIVARSAEHERALAQHLSTELSRLHGGWSLFIPRLPDGSVTLAALTRTFRATQVTPGPDRAVLHITDRDPRVHLSKNTMKSLARHHNRITKAGLDLSVDWLSDPAAVHAALPEVLAVHRARDYELRETSQLDDPKVEGFYEKIVQNHSGRFELLTLRIGGEMAAYALCLRDQKSLYVFDNRMSPAFGSFAPGLIANAEVVKHALADPAIETLDWGPGIQRYKSSNANTVSTSNDLTVWSSPTYRALLDTRRKMIARIDR